MTIRDILFKAYNILKEASDEFYVADSQILLQYVLKKDRLFILTNMEHEIEEEKSEKYLSCIELRKNKMPVKYIIGHCEFMGLDFYVKEGVLIPRPDTEILVEEVIKIIQKNKFNSVCDVCTGTGAIGLSIANYEKNTDVLCIDISDVAINVCKINKEKFKLDKVKIEKGDLLSKSILRNDKFDVVVSNPPYISEGEISNLMEDVKNYEPHIALSGGNDGLDFYRRITEQSIKVLKPRGLLAYEIGYDQGESVKAILLQYGFYDVVVIKDLAHNDRVVLGFRWENKSIFM